MKNSPHPRLPLGTLSVVLALFSLSYTWALSDASKSSARAASAISSVATNSGKTRTDTRTWREHCWNDWYCSEGLIPALQLRGGESYSSPPDDPYALPVPAIYNQQPQQSNNNYEDGFANYYDSPQSGQPMDPEHVFHEPVQDRLDRWRNEQMQKYQNLSPEQELSPVDDKGRAKLVQHVSKAARAFIFTFFVFRDVHLIDLADHHITKTLSKRLVRLSLMVLFVGNLAGVVATFTSPSHSSKKRMKMILNGNKLVEMVLLFWSFFRLTINPTVHVPREVFVASILHSLIFLLQAQSFTRLTWDENVAPPMGPPTKQRSSSSNLYQEISPPSWEDPEPTAMYASSTNPSQTVGGYYDPGKSGNGF
ncbi:hypothetical protein IV203_032672 [Nitzschia inconspicua]|uniref:Uncharacterized protein n=1 Tax=Nitzschia inconspicua TaxID=303405 RepID=A0A9K3KKP9_9STRA|nr:hypothetical protein IV203_032672 [Nitzschia inconspicua]